MYMYIHVKGYNERQGGVSKFFLDTLAETLYVFFNGQQRYSTIIKIHLKAVLKHKTAICSSYISQTCPASTYEPRESESTVKHSQMP